MIISAEKVANVLECIGIKLQWNLLGKNTDLRRTFEKRRYTARALQDYLKRFGQTRNRIAHTGCSGIVVTETDFERLLGIFRAFGRALTSFVHSDVNEPPSHRIAVE